MAFAAAQVLHSAAPAGKPARLEETRPPDDNAPRPGSVQYFGDWAVGCDNVLRCEAMALQQPDGVGTETVMLDLTRAGGPDGALTVRISSLNPLPSRLSLLVDGRVVAQLKGQGGDTLLIDGALALKVAQTMAEAITIELVTKKGDVLATPSSAGLGDSLKLMDARQGRTGTHSAIYAPGSQPMSRVPNAPSVPTVPQVPSPDADTAAKLSDTELAAARKLAQCDPGLKADSVTELVPLDGKTALLLLPCEAGAYNVSAVPLVATGDPGERALSIARFDFQPGFTGEPGKPPLVVNALWDARRGVLSSLAKGRGAGDCGASEDYVWDGAMFRLIESRAMHVCRGAWEWIRLWTANPVRKEQAPAS
jgi:hypothetical protein